MNMYKGYFIPEYNRSKFPNECCESAKCPNIDCIDCDECLFDFTNEDTFFKWLELREKKIKRIIK